VFIFETLGDEMTWREDVGCVGGVDVWPDGIFPDVRVPGLEDTSGIVMTVKPIVDNCVGNVLLLLHIEGGDGVKDGISLVATHLFEHFRRGQGRIVVQRPQLLITIRQHRNNTCAKTDCILHAQLVDRIRPRYM
jgi:hypothetical protein